MLEEWREIPDYEGSYQVSNLGRVRSLARVIERSNGTTLSVRARILKLGTNERGLVFVKLTKEGQSVSLNIAKAMLLAFVGIPQPGYVARHRKGYEDRLDNIYWGTEDDFNKERAARMRGLRKRLSDEDVRQIRAVKGWPCAALAELFECSRVHISHIRRNVSRKEPEYEARQEELNRIPF